MVIGNVFGLFRDQSIFDADVDQFRPERFLNADGSVNRQRELYVYQHVFGWGRRACPGSGKAFSFD